MLKKFYTYLRITVATPLLVAGLVLATVGQPLLVSAAPVDVLDACDNGSKVCKGTNKNSLNTLLTNVVNLLLTVIGIIAVIMIIIGGIRYTTSAGDSSQINSAKDTIIYAIVGLVIAILSFAIVNFVLTKV